MTEPSDELPLATEFPAATYDVWRGLAQAALKGAHYEDRLQNRTADGLIIEPLYSRSQSASPVAGRPPGAHWQVLQRIDHPDAAAAHAQVLEDLKGAAN